MTEKQLGREAYAKPEVEMLNLETEKTLLTASETTGGHNPGQITPPAGDAKRGWFDEEEGDEEEFESED